MNTFHNYQPSPHRQRALRARGEQGWVLLATVVLSAVAASLTVTWARHAVLQKSQLEMSSGASEAEEATRSGLERTREKMRRGSPPGSEADGEEDIVTTDSGDVIICEREVDPDERSCKRRVRARSHKPGKDFNLDFKESASARGRCRVQPGSGGGAAGGRITRVDCSTGASVIAASDLIVISGNATYANTTILGVFLLEAGAELTLDKVVLQGGIVTRAGLCDDTSPQSGGARPRVNLVGGTHINPGYTLKDIAIMAPDAVVVADSNARINLHGFIAADEIDFECRGSLHGMVVAETELNIGSKIVRPGESRGARDFPDTIVPGAEVMTSISFPEDVPSEAELDLMETYDANS
ncbi:MAG: hypothetical protein DHS20C15_24710 [Planctomycetota bacterium]|nr:MAG: hypothetical protein DHS20C15_24710 [Planctomycetota bacterium]